VGFSDGSKQERHAMPTIHAIAQTDPTSWAWVFNQGLAVGLLLLGAWGIYQWGNWFGAQIFIPIRDAAIGHLKATTDTMREIGKSLSDHHEAIKELKTEQKQSFKTLDERLSMLDLRIGKLTDSDRS
jgi:hypothetical protein